MEQLKTVAEVRAAFVALPKLLDGWLMVGYRQWYRRVYMKKPKDTKELAANKQLKSLTDLEWKALKTKVKSKLK